MYQDICNCICQNTKKWRYTVNYVKTTAQLLFKSRFPKVGPTCRRQVVNPRHQTPQGQSCSCKAWNSPTEYPSWVARCDIQGSDDTMLNPIFWQKVQGQKHPGKWDVTRNFACLLLVSRTSQENVLIVIAILTCKWIRMRGWYNFIFIKALPQKYVLSPLLGFGVHWMR